MVDPSKRRKFNLRLHYWYKKNSRDYPWRKENDFYHLLIAEILLQKTNADKVVPAYLSICEHFPTPALLKNASEKKLKKIISPLGLINRANTLKTLAADLSNWDDQSLSKEKLLKLKGVGDYIANSILIHANGKRLSLLDPNFIRIYSRVFDVSSDRSRPRTDKKLWEEAKTLLPKKNISRYVYSMLDFGALICQARTPKCKECPMYLDLCSGI